MIVLVAKTSRDQILKQQEASHEQTISQQVSKGFELLGSDKVAVRLGGVYALEGVMNASEQYHRPVLEALCAFVREATKSAATPARPMQDKSKQPPAGAKPPPTTPPLPTDIQAALTVIGRRANKTDHADLSYVTVVGCHRGGRPGRG